MSNGFEVDEDGFKGLDHDDQMRAIFQNVYTIKKYMIEQPKKCEIEMDNKIKNNNKIHRRINFGIGGLGAGGIVGLIEGIKSFFNG